MGTNYQLHCRACEAPCGFRGQPAIYGNGLCPTCLKVAVDKALKEAKIEGYEETL